MTFEAEPVGDLSSTAALSVYRVGDILIDCGSNHTKDALVAALQENPPTQIVLTHQHEDHAGGVMAVRRAFGDIPVFAPHTHLPIIASTDRVPWFRERFWGDPEPIKDAEGYDEGHTFDTRGLSLRTILTPGHTPDHMTLVATWGRQTYALTGDLFLSIRHQPAWFESAADDMALSQRKIARLAPQVCLLPAHGRVRENGSEILNRSARKLDDEIEAVYKTTGTMAEVAESLYGPDPTGELTNGEISHVAFVRSVLDPVRTLPAAPLTSRMAKGTAAK